MSTQIPPPFDIPTDKEKDRPAGIDRIPPNGDAPPAEREPMLEPENYKLPPMEPPAPIREPRLPGA